MRDTEIQNIVSMIKQCPKIDVSICLNSEECDTITRLMKEIFSDISSLPLIQYLEYRKDYFYIEMVNGSCLTVE